MSNKIIRLSAFLASVLVVLTMTIIPTFAQDLTQETEKDGEEYSWSLNSIPLFTLDFAVVGKYSNGNTNALEKAGAIRLPKYVFSTDYQRYEIVIANGGTYRIQFTAGNDEYTYYPEENSRLYYTFEHNNSKPYVNNEYKSTLNLRCDYGTLYKNGDFVHEEPFVMSVAVGQGVVSQSWSPVTYPGWEDGDFYVMFLPLTSCKIGTIYYTDLQEMHVDFYLPFSYVDEDFTDVRDFFGTDAQKIDLNFSALLSMTNIDWNTAPPLLQYTKKGAIKVTFGEGVFDQVYQQIKTNWYVNGLQVGYDQGYEIGSLDGYDQGYSNGFDVGYDQGALIGYQEGYDYGYDDGYDYGQTIGYQEGLATAENGSFGDLISATFDGLYNTFYNVLNFDIPLGDGYINIAAIAGMLIALVLIIAVVRFILR